MNKHNDNAVEIGILSVLFFALMMIMFLGMMTPARAQDDTVTVCRMADNTYEFRNIPQSWLDAGGWWYIAGDVTLEGNTLKASGIPVAEYYSDDVYQGEAALGNADRSIILKGTAQTVPCDMPVTPTPLPVQANLSVVSTNRTCVAKYLETQVILVCSG